MNDFSNVEHFSLGSSVYTQLREALVEGRFKPNDRLRIRDLATQFGTSVTPVRDAILRLCDDRALEMRSVRDIRVPVLNLAEYEEIYRLRLELEGLAGELAATRVDADSLVRLEQLIRANQDAIAANDMRQAMRLNQQFHFSLASLSGSALLQDFIDSLWMRAGPVIALAYQAFSERVAITHHWEVLAALREGNPPQTREAIRSDIQDGHAMMVGFLADLRQDLQIP